MIPIWKQIKESVSQFLQGYKTGTAVTQPVTNPLIIDRKTWLHGEGISFSSLLRTTDRKRCCLGFYCKYLGVSDDEMLGIGHPSFLSRHVQERCGLYNSWFYYPQDKVKCNPPMPIADAFNLVRYNDRERGTNIGEQDKTPITEAYREQKIAEIFAQYGIDVRFVN